jgi:glycosyltransferase involved in cell wall biosynthesis
MSKAPMAEQTREGITHILMLTRVLDTGGIERDVSKFARYLADKGFHPHVACFNPGGMRWREIEEAGISVLTVPVKSFRSWSTVVGARIMRRYIVQHDIRLVHAFDVPADIFAVPLARLWKLPVISSQLCYRDLCTRKTRLIMAIIDRLASGVFVNCEGIANHLHDDWKLARDRIHICYNGYEPREFHSQGRKRQTQLAEASTVVGSVALLRPEKNLKMLIEAFATLLKVDSKARLLIVGDGPDKVKLKQRASELGIRDACLFQDAAGQPAEWMKAIDIFVLPSASEGFSNSLLEAMACGCCPVASRVGGTPELVAHQEHGLLFESGNVEELARALIQLATHPEERQAMANTAANFVRAHLTMQHAVARLSGIYKEILGRPIDRTRGEQFVPLNQRAKASGIEREMEVSHTRMGGLSE